jgi:hypothetical protein
LPDEDGGEAAREDWSSNQSTQGFLKAGREELSESGEELSSRRVATVVDERMRGSAVAGPGRGRVRPGGRQQIGTSCNYWNTWLDVVENMRELGCL